MKIDSKEELEKKVDELEKYQPWTQKINLPYGVITKEDDSESPGRNYNKWERIKPLLEYLDISNNKIIDLGCNEGYFPVKLSEMGVKEIIAIDADEKRLKKAEFVLEQLDVQNVSLHKMSIFDLNVDTFGHFDLALCFGFLHRVPDPYSVIRTLTELTDTIIFEWKTLKDSDHNLAIARYAGGDFRQHDPYGTPYWWLSFKCVEEILQRHGFQHFYRVDNPFHRRAILVTSKKDLSIFNRSDDIKYYNKINIFARHTYRYLKTIKAILNGQLNR